MKLKINDFVNGPLGVGQVKAIDGNEITYMDDEHNFYWGNAADLSRATRPSYWTNDLNSTKIIG